MKSQGSLFFRGLNLLFFFENLAARWRSLLVRTVPTSRAAPSWTWRAAAVPHRREFNWDAAQRFDQKRRWGFWMVGGVGEGRWFSGAFFRISREYAWLEAKSWRFVQRIFRNSIGWFLGAKSPWIFSGDDKEMKATPLVEFCDFFFQEGGWLLHLKQTWNLKQPSFIHGCWNWMIRLWLPNFYDWEMVGNTFETGCFGVPGN